jgi:hypothetical protein
MQRPVTEQLYWACRSIPTAEATSARKFPSVEPSLRRDLAWRRARISSWHRRASVPVWYLVHRAERIVVLAGILDADSVASDASSVPTAPGNLALMIRRQIKAAEDTVDGRYPGRGVPPGRIGPQGGGVSPGEDGAVGYERQSAECAAAEWRNRYGSEARLRRDRHKHMAF